MPVSKIDLNLIEFHKEDLPKSIADSFTVSMAIDCEAMGLNLRRDKLCLVQIRGEDEHGVQEKIHLVEFGDYDKAQNLKKVLNNSKIQKIFHFARFDVAALTYRLGIDRMENVFCTKIASKLTRTYTESHGLKSLVSEILGIEISKQEQSSDWGCGNITDAQKMYAATDVKYLHKLRDNMIKRLERIGLSKLAKAYMDFLPDIAAADIAGYDPTEVISH